MKLKQLLLILAMLVASCLLSFSLFSQIPTSGLVGYWPLDGNYNDAGPYTLNGTNIGTTTTTNKAGVANKAMNFSNPTSTVVQYATHPLNSNLNFSGSQDYTISFIMYINSPWIHFGGFYENNMNYGGPGVWIWQSGGPTDYRIQFNYKNSSVGTTPLPIGVWKAVSAVRSAGVLKVYIDGVLNNSVAEGTMTPVYTYPARIGSMFFNGMTPPQYNGLNGKMDELRVYNRALTDAEIYQIASITLPLKLGDFTAVKKTTGIQLNWQTISETNTASFEIERSNDGVNYTSIGNVAAAGNSVYNRNYSFIDNNPLPATNFYRLKMIDIDRAFSYSRIVVIKNDKDIISLQLFPNPVHDVLQLQLSSHRKEMVTIAISDVIGRIIYSKPIQLNEGQNAISIPVQSFIPGTYHLLVDKEEGRETGTFIRQ